MHLRHPNSCAQHLLSHLIEPLLDVAPARHLAIECMVELRTVVVVLQVAQLVQHDVIDALARRPDQKRVERDASCPAHT